MPSEKEVLVSVHHLCKDFVAKRSLFGKPEKILHAVDDVSFDIHKGETLGIVGESGCGKSTLGRSLLRLIEPTSGSIMYEGKDLLALPKEEMRQMRRKMQLIFQDPYASLNPRMTVAELIGAPLEVFDIGTKDERQESIKEIMGKVGLTEQQMNRYPHEFSGGQRQRIVIARAMILKPDFVVCDEPVSALDVSVRSQVLNLLKSLQEERGLTYLFISHDLSVVKYVSNRIAVMYLGQIVELADKQGLYEHPAHPYTKALLDAIPLPEVTDRKENLHHEFEGDVPSPLNPPSGCYFRTRCPYASQKCAEVRPVLREIGNNHYMACHIACK